MSKGDRVEVHTTNGGRITGTLNHGKESFPTSITLEGGHILHIEGWRVAAILPAG
jgi:hypothetical protein